MFRIIVCVLCSNYSLFFLIFVSYSLLIIASTQKNFQVQYYDTFSYNLTMSHYTEKSSLLLNCTIITV